MSEQEMLIQVATMRTEIEVLQGDYELLTEENARLRADLSWFLGEVEDLRAAVKVYTSHNHLCRTRPCSCGAYSSLVDALAYEDKANE